MKKSLPIIVVAVLLVLGIIFVPRVVHTCDDCGETFFGTGYTANALVEAANDYESDDEEKDLIICEKCAEKHHAISIGLGQNTLDDFKRDLF